MRGAQLARDHQLGAVGDQIERLFGVVASLNEIGHGRHHRFAVLGELRGGFVQPSPVLLRRIHAAVDDLGEVGEGGFVGFRRIVGAAREHAGQSDDGGIEREGFGGGLRQGIGGGLHRVAERLHVLAGVGEFRFSQCAGQLLDFFVDRLDVARR